VRALLDELCANQYARTLLKQLSLLEQLQAANMIQPFEDEKDTYEFHSFVTEGAIRAILQTPVTDEHLAQPKTPSRKAEGLHPISRNSR